MRHIAALVLSAAACAREAPAPHAPPAAPASEDQPVQILALRGPVSHARAELSGLAWHGDTLVLLPQYPERFGNALFTLPRAEIVDAVEGRRTAPLEPKPLPFAAPGLAAMPGYEGFEAIAFAGSRAYLTVEAADPAGGMRGYLVSGTIGDGGLRLDGPATPIAPAAVLPNMAEESLVVAGDRVLTFFEANGRHVNPRPAAHVFGLDSEPRGTVPFPPVDFRVTDATPPDADGFVWVVNTLYLGDAHLFTGAHRPVEQLLELRWTGDAVVRTPRPPLVLVRNDDRTTRNWEGIARLGDLGFLLVTDRYPGTLLGFVRAPR